jgi:hypothetical protein
MAQRRGPSPHRSTGPQNKCGGARGGLLQPNVPEVRAPNVRLCVKLKLKLQTSWSVTKEPMRQVLPRSRAFGCARKSFVIITQTLFVSALPQFVLCGPRG